MKLFPKRLKCALIAGLCWTNNSPFALANISASNQNVTSLGYVTTSPQTVTVLFANTTQPNNVTHVFPGDDQETAPYNPDNNTLLMPNPQLSPQTDTVLPHLIGRTELPGDYDTWEAIYKSKRIYVDKTKFLIHFLDDDPLYFCGKPRRFGKTLFMQMTASFFRGEQNYFNGTHVAKCGNTREKNGTWLQYPVISVKFNEIKLDDIDFRSLGQVMRMFERRLGSALKDIATSYNTDVAKYEDDEFTITDLISLLYNKFNLPVVILVDEYDSVINKALKSKNVDLSEKILSHANEFYDMIKAASSGDRVKLALVTGVHKYAINSLASGPNSFVDISWEPKFATSMGFTREEIETTFKSKINEFAIHLNQTPEYIMNKTRTWYDGYNFGYDVLGRNTSDNVYNPISVINALKKFDFGVHWSQTATAHEIVKKIYENPYRMENFENLELSSFDLNQKYQGTTNIPLPEYMLQTGYLKIISYNIQQRVATLSYPNLEIEKFLEDQIENYVPSSGKFLSEERATLAEITSSLEYCTPDISKAVRFINQLEFPKYHHPLDQTPSEYEVTRRLCRIFHAARIGYNYSVLREIQECTTDAPDQMTEKKKNRLQMRFGKRRFINTWSVENTTTTSYVKKNQSNDIGDIDIFTTSFHINYAIEIKVKDEPWLAYEKIITYFALHFDIFKQVVQFKDRINLLAFTFFKKKNTNICSWVLLPCLNDKILENRISASDRALISNVTRYIKEVEQNNSISIRMQGDEEEEEEYD